MQAHLTRNIYLFPPQHIPGFRSEPIETTHLVKSDSSAILWRFHRQLHTRKKKYIYIYTPKSVPASRR